MKSLISAERHPNYTINRKWANSVNECLLFEQFFLIATDRVIMTHTAQDSPDLCQLS